MVNEMIHVKPTKLYPAVLREIANLIEARRVLEVNIAALIEVVNYVEQRKFKALSRKLTKSNPV